MAVSLWRVGSSTTYFEFTSDGKVTFTDGTGTTTLDPVGDAVFSDGTGTVTGSSAGTGVTEVNYTTGDGRVKTVLTLASTPIVLADDAGVAAYGGVKLYDFPEGVIIFDGGHITCSLALSAAGVNADFDSDIAMGTATATTGATLTTTEADLVPSTTVPQAVSSAVAAAPAYSATANVGLIFDGSGTAKDLFLNMKVDDVDHDVTSTPTNILVTGTVTFYWRMLNDH